MQLSRRIAMMAFFAAFSLQADPGLEPEPHSGVNRSPAVLGPPVVMEPEEVPAEFTFAVENMEYEEAVDSPPLEL